MVDADMIAKMKDGVRILNFSRDGLVNSTAVLEAVKSGKVAKYVTDFGTDDILGEENIICLPHLGASTPESEENCAVMAFDQVKEYLENGNIINSVNYPAFHLQEQMLTIPVSALLTRMFPNFSRRFSHRSAAMLKICFQRAVATMLTQLLMLQAPVQMTLQKSQQLTA